MSDAPTPTRFPRQPPNYAARRMLVSTIAITAVIAIAVIGWRVVRGDGGSEPGTAGSWDRIALVDRTTGDVTLVDADGETVDTIVGAGRAVDVHAHRSRLALVGNDLIVLVDDDSEPTAIPIDRGSTVTFVSTEDTADLVVGNAAGGDVVIVDVILGTTTDVGELAEQTNPLIFTETLRHADDGSTFAFADAANFQTIMIRRGVVTPVFFPDQPVAVSDELIATSQVVGRESDVTIYDLERRSQAMSTIEIPAGGVMVGDELVVVSVDGTVYRLGRDDQEAERLGEVAVPAGGTVRWVHPSLDGDRLVVFGGVFQAVIDVEGKTVFTTTFTAPVDAPAPSSTWTCLPVGGAGGYHSLIALETGEQLADLTGLDVTGTSSDGCTVIGERAGLTELITTDGSVRLGKVRAASLGPDGRTVVRKTTTGTVELLRIDDDLEIAEPIDLSAAAPANVSVAFLDD